MSTDSELLIDTLHELGELQDEIVRLRNWIEDNCDGRGRGVKCDDCVNDKCPLSTKREEVYA